MGHTEKEKGWNLLQEMVRVASRRVVSCSLCMVLFSSCKILPGQIITLDFWSSRWKIYRSSLSCDATGPNIGLATQSISQESIASFLQNVQGMFYHRWRWEIGNKKLWQQIQTKLVTIAELKQSHCPALSLFHYVLSCCCIQRLLT